MSELDPLTGKDPSSLTLATLTERLAMERALRESFERHIRELLDERRDSIEKALRLQAEEYERRLDGLNGEAGRLAKVLGESVPREVFTNYVASQEEKLALASGVAESARIELANQVTIERNARIRLEGSLGTWRAIAGFLGASGVVALLLGLVAVFGPKG